MIIGILSIWIFTWMIIYAFLEFVRVRRDIVNKKYIYWDKQHSIEHIVYIFTYIIWNLSLLFWILCHSCFLTNSSLSYTLIILSLTWYYLINHIWKERIW
jgi:hypothetical protein